MEGNKSARSCDSYPCGQVPRCWVNGSLTVGAVPGSYLAPPAEHNGPPYSHSIIYSLCVLAGEARACVMEPIYDLPSNSIDPIPCWKGVERKLPCTPEVQAIFERRKELIRISFVLYNINSMCDDLHIHQRSKQYKFLWLIKQIAKIYDKYPFLLSKI